MLKSVILICSYRETSKMWTSKPSCQECRCVHISEIDWHNFIFIVTKWIVMNFKIRVRFHVRICFWTHVRICVGILRFQSGQCSTLSRMKAINTCTNTFNRTTKHLFTFIIVVDCLFKWQCTNMCSVLVVFYRSFEC